MSYVIGRNFFFFGQSEEKDHLEKVQEEFMEAQVRRNIFFFTFSSLSIFKKFRVRKDYVCIPYWPFCIQIFL